MLSRVREDDDGPESVGEPRRAVSPLGHRLARFGSYYSVREAEMARTALAAAGVIAAA